MCKTPDRIFSIVHRECDSGTIEMVNFMWLCAGTIIGSEGHGQFSRTVNYDIGCTVLIAKSMTANNDWCCPLWNKSWYILYNNRLTKNCSIQNIPDSSVWRFVHFLQAKFNHTGFVRSDGSTFNANLILFYRIGCINSHLIIGCIAILNSKIIVFNVDIQKRQNQFFSDHFPDDTCHFIPVEFHHGIQYFNFLHLKEFIL